MACGFWFGASVLLSVWATAKCADIPNGVLDMECRDRYLIIAVDLSFAGNEPRFEAVDDTGVYPISMQYAAECGYSLSILPLPGHAELRASYFSCHADNQDDQVFAFSFNMIATDEGKEITYALNKTCSPSLPFSPREVTCEINYMEVSVRSDFTCPSGTKKDDWNSVFSTAYESATSDWQVMFQRDGQKLATMAISEARKKGYVFDVTDGRLVFRTPYGQPHSFSNMVDGVPVESIHPTLFSRQSWVVLMVDLVAACSMHDGSYDGSQVIWQTPQMLAPLVPGMSGLKSIKVSMGVNGQLLEQPIADERGYVIDTSGAVVQIAIPYNAEGGYRQSFVMNNVYHEFFVFYLYFEQLFVDEDFVDTRLRLLRPLTTPLLLCHYFSVNQTVLEERIFTVYLGDFLEDVDLVAVKLNGQDFTHPLVNLSSDIVSEVPQPNNTHGYILRVPFDDPIVIMRSSKSGIFEYTLNINFTLNILPENESFYHLTTVVAVTKDVFPPAFEGTCCETGICFKLDHRPFDYLWDVTIGPDPLSSELATERGYIMHNDSQSLLLEVPLFSPGYTYENIGLKTFLGSFELLIRNSKTLEIQASSTKTCSFQTTEIIVCSTDGVMTVVADLSMAIPGGNPSRTTLKGGTCGPKRADHSRVMFSFPLNTCGTTVKIGRDHVIYENEIVINQKLLTMKRPVKARNATEMVTVQCVYPILWLHRLFATHRFESDYPGEGRIVHTEFPIELELQIQHTTTTIEPTTEGTTTTTTLQTTKSNSTRGLNFRKLPAMHPPAYYIKVFSFLRDLSDTVSMIKDVKDSLLEETEGNST